MARIVVAVILAHGPLHAEEASGASETLFLEGKKLMQEGRIEEACEKFKASHDADKTATGTLLNLALCNEQRGRTASAWGEFRQVAAESAIAHREDRINLAREHEAALFPKLSYVTIYVRNDARMSGMRIVLDRQREITEAMWQTKLPIDPGEHTVVVEAPARIPKSYPIVVKDSADWQSVDVLPLVVAPVSESTKPAMIGSPGRRTAGYVVGAVGLAAIGTGAVFGVLAMNKDSEIKTACGGYQCAKPNYQTNADKESDVQTFARVADVAIGAGAALLITGAVLVWTGRDRPAPRTGDLHIRASTGPRGGAMLVEGSF